MSSLHKANLDFDTLLHVLVLAQDRTTLCSLMQTCHSLYIAGSPYLLTYPIHLKTRDELGYFCKWMLPKVEEERYLRLFRQICIYMRTLSNNEDQELSTILAEILRRATSLEELSIELPADLNDLAFGSSVLREVIQHLTIRSLRVKHAGHRMVEFLSTIRSPLVSLDVHFLFSPRRSPFNPLPSMRSLVSTLTHLTIANAHPILEQTLKFPLVRVLNISSRFPTLALPWIHTFPNVTHLTYRLSADEAMRDLHSDEVRVNSRSQIHHLQGWAQLSRVQGGPGALYSLGLHSQVHELVVDTTRIIDLDHLLLVILDFQPVMIRLSTNSDDEPFDANWILQTILESSTRLSHLEIRITQDLDDSQLQSLMLRFAVTFPMALSVSKVKTLFLHILIGSTDNHMGTNDPIGGTIAAELTSSMETLARITQPLESFTICLQGPRCGAFLWERVGRTTISMRMLQGWHALQYVRRNSEALESSASQ